MPTLVLTPRACDNLTGAGDLKLPRNRPLKNPLAEYCAAADLIAVVLRAHARELVQTFQPFIIDNLDFAAVRPEAVPGMPS